MPLNRSTLVVGEPHVALLPELERDLQTQHRSYDVSVRNDTPFAPPESLRTAQSSGNKASRKVGSVSLPASVAPTAPAHNKVIIPLESQAAYTVDVQDPLQHKLRATSGQRDALTKHATAERQDKDRMSIFDNTESLRLDDSFNENEDEDQTAVLLATSHRSSNDRKVSGQNDVVLHSGRLPKASRTHVSGMEIDIGPDWREKVAAERRLQQVESHHQDDLRGTKNLMAEESRFFSQFQIDQSSHSDTPTRSHAPVPLPSKLNGHRLKKSTNGASQTRIKQNNGSTINDNVPHDPQQPSILRKPEELHSTLDPNKTMSALSAKGKEPYAPPEFQTNALQSNAQHMPVIRQSGFEPSRTSDYPTSSEDEINLSISKQAIGTHVSPTETYLTRKRSHEDSLDYDRSVLKTKSYEELHREDFNLDPRRSVTKHPSELQKGNHDLFHRLEYLKALPVREQKEVFNTQTDDEWSQTGEWFMNKFREELGQLMGTRAERRKISLRFESEVRRRQRDVEKCATSLEVELGGLKKGGGQLIDGRRASSRLNTPSKQPQL